MDGEEMRERELERKMRRARSGLNEKLSALEEQVGETIEEASEGIRNLKEALNLREQIERHPWTFFGGALGVGFLAGHLGSPRQAPVEQLSPVPSHGNGRKHHGGRSEPGWFSQLYEHVRPEMQKLKFLAAGMALDYFKESVTSSLPEHIRPEVENILEEMKNKLVGLDEAEKEAEEPAVGRGMPPDRGGFRTMETP